MSTKNFPLVAKKEEILNNNINQIWDLVVDNTNYQWRTAIKNIEIYENGKSWVEYYNKKSFTKFTLIEKNKPKLYSFNMDNKYFYGNWVGEFFEINQYRTKCIFTETIYIKNRIIKIVAKLIWSIEALQEKYFIDLKKKLNENN